MYQRLLDLSICGDETCFLWGPRQAGKSTLLRATFPKAVRYDLLLASEFRRLSMRPETVREECEAQGLTGGKQSAPIIIDEIQKVPDLLDEVHWLIENRGLRFILCGSSARKVKRGHANLLGGRAVRCELFPLVSPEIENFSLNQALNTGLLPRHYQRKSPRRVLQAYVADYLKEEVAAEALTRNIPAFGRFLEVAALCNGEVINHANIARECGVSSPTVKEYFLILEDTLLGEYLLPYRRRRKRRLAVSPKFFFFDIGPVNHLAHRGTVESGSEAFGRAFEHFLWMEIRAHRSYSEAFYPFTFWRTASQLEVDFILGEHEIAVEAKATEMAARQHLRGLRAFKEEYGPKRSILVSRDRKARKTEDGIEILPWERFLDELWDGKVIG